MHRFLEICLRLWQRSKKGYEEFRETGYVRLTSGIRCHTLIYIPPQLIEIRWLG